MQELGVEGTGEHFFIDLIEVNMHQKGVSPYTTSVIGEMTWLKGASQMTGTR